MDGAQGTCGLRVRDVRGEYGSTALHQGWCNGHMEVVRILLQAGANSGVQDEDGKRPLHEVSVSDHVEVVRVLLQAGLSADAVAVFRMFRRFE